MDCGETDQAVEAGGEEGAGETGDGDEDVRIYGVVCMWVEVLIEMRMCSFRGCRSEIC